MTSSLLRKDPEPFKAPDGQQSTFSGPSVEFSAAGPPMTSHRPPTLLQILPRSSSPHTLSPAPSIPQRLCPTLCFQLLLRPASTLTHPETTLPALPKLDSQPRAGLLESLLRQICARCCLPPTRPVVRDSRPPAFPHPPRAHFSLTPLFPTGPVTLHSFPSSPFLPSLSRSFPPGSVLPSGPTHYLIPLTSTAGKPAKC